MFNFCLYVFILYAAEGSARAILSKPKKKRRPRKQSPAHTRRGCRRTRQPLIAKRPVRFGFRRGIPGGCAG